ncbi:GNAT family N-acetyltransferase [Chloroflexota bacterium]
MSIEITTVRTKRDRRIFLTVPWRVYQGDPLWVPPVIPERMKAIDPTRGAFFKRGEADFFIAWKDGRPVGTICAAEDRSALEARGRDECIFGFFEYIEDYQVFEALLEKARDWGQNRGLKAFYGPFNLDYEDSYGVLIAGRDRPPALMCGHSPVYYQGFMERYGFTPARAANLAFCTELGEETPAIQRLARLADRVRRGGRVTIRGADFDDLEGEIDRVHRLLLEALAWSEDGVPWDRDALASIVEPFKLFADPELVLFAEVDGETVGWFPGVPNLNEVFKKANGLRYLWNYIPFFWHLRRQTECLAVKSVLVLPEHQKTGVAVLLFDEMAKRGRAKGYQWVDFSITGADNPDTIQLAERMGVEEYKRWQVYSLPFKR